MRRMTWAAKPSALASPLETRLADFFERHRARLRGMICLRLDRRLQGRIDPSDVLQETFIEALEEEEAIRPFRPPWPCCRSSAR